MAAVDPAFRGLSTGTPQFLTWRIVNFALERVPKDKYGEFYTGDAYIIYSSKQVGSALEMNIHFWLGEECSQDEAGTAAIKAVELDDHLGGSPTQYREVQGQESRVFLNYFKSGVQYQKGGAASGFNHVDHKLEPRLFHVKGKKTPRFKQIDISWSAMNSGDAFVLDIGEALFIWLGKECSRNEKLKAMEYARKLRDDRGKGNIVAVEEGEETVDQMGIDEYELFDEYLPLAEKGNLQSASAGGCDEANERKAVAALKLWKCSDEGGNLKVGEIGSAPLTKQMLDTNDVFIVDNGDAGIWVWCGRKANKDERKEGMANAMAFAKQRNYSSSVQVTKVNERAETAEFKALFKSWEKERLPGGPTATVGKGIARTVQTKFDAATLHQNPAMARDTGMVDDGSGNKDVYRIERKDNTYDMVLVKKFTNEMYGGDSYVILYTFMPPGGKAEYIIYYWLGRHSTQDERGVAARKTIELDDSLGGAATQVRVVHGKEPNHFLAMFNGQLRIYEGGKAGWGQEKDTVRGDTYLLQVRGTSLTNSKAEQVPCKAESLNSNDVFVLFSPAVVYIWAGKGATGDERENAKNVGKLSPKGYKLVLQNQEPEEFWTLVSGKGPYSTAQRYTLVVEGQEKEEFWALLGGKGEYSSQIRSPEEQEKRPTKLFQCSNATGKFIVEQILDFTQQDLLPEDVFILDDYDKLFIWVGNDARPEEKTMAQETALDYIKTDPSCRDEDTPVYLVKQGCENVMFVGYFGVWDRTLWSDGKSYEEIKKELGEKNIGMDQIVKKSKSGETSFSDVMKVSLEVLQAQEVPEGVDKMHKEKHLTDEEFQQVFGMSYGNFCNLAQWKQKDMKKKKNLF